MKLTHTNFQLILSWLSVLWEGLWLALWPSLGILGFAVGIALFDLPSWIPAWIHAALLVVGVVALATTLWLRSAISAYQPGKPPFDDCKTLMT